MIEFTCISPHPPLLLPTVGSRQDRQKVAATQEALEKLGLVMAQIKPELIIASSPHHDWGVNVPLHFLTKNLSPDSFKLQTIITGFESAKNHFESGRQLGKNLPTGKKIAWIASGDLSHRLKEDGPYGLHPDGPKFDQQLIELIKNKKIDGILKLDPEMVENAGECGLRSICLALGALEGSKTSWQPEILSYEAPFGVGYLVAKLK